MALEPPATSAPAGPALSPATSATPAWSAGWTQVGEEDWRYEIGLPADWLTLVNGDRAAVVAALRAMHPGLAGSIDSAVAELATSDELRLIAISPSGRSTVRWRLDSMALAGSFGGHATIDEYVAARVDDLRSLGEVSVDSRFHQPSRGQRVRLPDGRLDIVAVPTVVDVWLLELVSDELDEQLRAELLRGILDRYR